MIYVLVSARFLYAFEIHTLVFPSFDQTLLCLLRMPFPKREIHNVCISLSEVALQHQDYTPHLSPDCEVNIRKPKVARKSHVDGAA